MIGNGNLLQFIEPELQKLEMCKLTVKNTHGALKYFKQEFRHQLIEIENETDIYSDDS